MTVTVREHSLLQQLARSVDRLASVPALLILVLLAALFPFVLFPAHGIGEMVPLDLQFSYGSARVNDHLAALGAEGRRAYSSMLMTSDMVFPLVYATALSIALMLVLCRGLAAGGNSLCLFPYLIVMADWGENLCLAAAVRGFPGQADALARYASACTSLKWVLLAATLLVLLVAVVFRVAGKTRGR